MSELFADDYPSRTTEEGCGMSWIIPVALILAGLVAVVVWFRLFGPSDRH